jgi:PAS domain S-box-containing protein
VKLRQIIPSEFLKARLSRRIVSWIFLSIVLIEAVILVPSVYRRERELLGYLRSQSAAQASGLIDSLALSQLSGAALLKALQNLRRNPVVRGGALYSEAGELIGVFGQPPTLTIDQIQSGRQDRYWRRQGHYDALWAMSPLAGRYILVIRHDAGWVQREFFAFIGRIIALVLLIAVFVTLATMIGLERILIQPIMQLRQDLLKAGAAVQANADAKALAFASLADSRDDELGDVVAAFEQMFGQIKAAIASRQASETRFRTLVEQAADAFFVVDAAGQLTDVNQEACRSLGYSRDQLLCFSIFELHLGLSEADFQRLWDSLKPGQPADFEGQHRRYDGSLFPVEVRVAMMALGNQQYLLALARDITQRKKAEAMVARLAEIGELAATIVHEVRNPLTTVVLGLKSFEGMALTERSQRRLTLALEESERLQRLLSEILLYTRQPSLTLVALELNQFAQTLAPAMQALPAAQGRVVQLELAAEPLWVSGDADKLKQIMINLLTNACEAVEPDQVVRWQVAAAEPQLAQIRVLNGGSPIPSAVLAKLTQPFFTTKPMGNGLGLAVSRRIIEAHQGELQITSDAAGTVVTISLSRRPEPTDRG